jgi:hypothetical protein
MFYHVLPYHFIPMFYDFLWFYHGLIPKPPSDAAPNQGVEGHDVEAESSRTMKQELPSSLPFGVLWDWGLQEKCGINTYSTNSYKFHNQA